MNIRNTIEYKSGDFHIVTCPICGNETLDMYWICECCGWEYDYTADEDEESKLLYGKLEDLGFKTDGEDIKWNFTKFLVDKNGKIISRFAPTYEPEKLASIINDLLK